MRQLLTWTLVCAALVACGNDRRLESPTVRPSLEGSLEILPIPGAVVSTLPLSGLESGHSVLLDRGVSKSETNLSWHRFGTSPDLVEIAWLPPKHGAEGDTYPFRFRTYDANKQAQVENKTFHYNGDRVILYLLGEHEFTLEPLIPNDE